MKYISRFCFLLFAVSFFAPAQAQIAREFEIHVSDSGLYFDGSARKSDFHINEPGFEYFFGRRITPHGDCIKKYGDFLFLTWYLGGENNKNVMLSRLHIPTQTLETIKFPHTHVGYQHKYPHIGDSHNTIAVAVCPLDSTVHMLYDMHSYSKSQYPDTYFNYRVSFKGAANAPVGSFSIDLFKPRQNYMNTAYNYSDITYPNFFLNTKNELFVWFREGGNTNGAYKFAKYDGKQWGPFTHFSNLNAKGKGNPYNWGLYGNMKYINGKLRIGFLKRMSNNSDEYVYNNGFHYAYTNDPAGKTEWYNYKDEPVSLPVIKPEKLFFYEPGDVVTQGGTNSVRMAGGADFTVTENESVHFITNGVKSTVDNKSKNVHAYKKAGDTTFTTTTDFPGGSLYAVGGNQVYLIDKENDRIQIYSAEGGTNDWKKLYTATDGIKMLHSSVLIADGKLFVFAMTNGSGSARPIYVQMYHLDIPQSGPYGPYGFTHAANEGDSVEINGTVDIAYGAKGNYTYLYDQTEDCGCDSITFGSNPAPDEERHCYVKPVVFANGVSLDKASHSLLIGQTFQLQAKMSPVNAKNQSVSWSSLDPTIAQVNSDGKVEAKALGTTTIVVKTDDGGFTDSCEVKVVEVIYPNVIYFDAEQEQSPAKNLVDGDATDNSRWSAQVFPKSIVVDYGETLNFIGSALHAYKDRSYHFTIAISDSANSGFVTVVDQSGAVSGQPIKNSFSATPGRYVKLTVTGATGYTSNWVSIRELEMFTEDVVNSINDASRGNKIKIYPNPSSGLVYFSGANVQQARVFTLSGQLVKTFAVASNQVDLSELPGGMYIIELEEANGLRVINKIVLE